MENNSSSYLIFYAVGFLSDLVDMPHLSHTYTHIIHTQILFLWQENVQAFFHHYKQM